MDQALSESTGLKAIDIADRAYYMVGAPMPTVGWAVISVVDKELTEQPKNAMLGEYNRINDGASEQFNTGTARTMRTIALLFALVFLVGLWAALIAASRIADG